MTNHITFNHLNPSSQADLDMARKSVEDTIAKFKHVLATTEEYRKQWTGGTKSLIIDTLQDVVDRAKLPHAQIVLRENVQNLEAVVLDLGRIASGISEKMDDSGVLRAMLKSNGSLFYQQLYNGKVIVMMLRPFIEGFGQPQPPVNLEILRPDEISATVILRHVEIFLNDMISWEDFDDDAQRSNIGFNPIGFNSDKEKPQS